MRIRVLGPLELGTDAGTPSLGSTKQRGVLALLLVRHNALVPISKIIDELWGDHPPPSAVANARMYAANLRRLLAGIPQAPKLVRQGDGYVLKIDTSKLDLSDFRDLMRRGREAMGHADFTAAVAAFDAGIRLWRGPPLADIPSGPTLADWRTVLEDERISGVEDGCRALLGAGRFDRAAIQAGELLAIHPLREHAHALLVRARYAGGDTAGALAAWDSARRALVDQLGIEPGEELSRLRQEILEGTPMPRAARTIPNTGDVRPRQLPPDITNFTGRAAQLRQLDALLANQASEAGTAAVISSVSGTAGVGKTALAVHWAHWIADRFPDGQLYVNLRGFDAGNAVMTPEEAIRGFLDALGVAPARIPNGLDAQVGLYRSILAGMRLLIVLDNARDAEQVRPLMPGSPGCLALVTSRNQLTGLIAADGAHPIALDLLPAEEARRLLAHRLGAERVAAAPAAVEDIIVRCAGLPLALVIVAARAAIRPKLALGAVARELHATADGLDAFDGGDSATNVRAAFSWSYETLTPGAARLFRLLGLHPGPDVSLPAAASLCMLPVGQVRPMLTELTLAHLIAEHAPGRYVLHDLLRAYAAELAVSGDPEVDRRAALHRLLDHYLHTAHAADSLLFPHRQPMALSSPQPGVVPEPVEDQVRSLAWFSAEHPILLAAVAASARAGFVDHTWQLACAFAGYLDCQGQWRLLADVQTTALDAARSASRSAQVHVHRELARASARLDRHDDAGNHYQKALDLCRESADHGGQALVHCGLSWLNDLRGDLRKALDHARQALDLYRLAGDEAGEADALNNVGWRYAQLGDHQQAIVYCEQSLPLVQRIGDAIGEADVLDSLGYAHHHLGLHGQAITYFERSLALYRKLGARYQQADTLSRLGDTFADAGHPDATRDAWQSALSILRELGHSNADLVNAKLVSLTAPTGAGR